MLRLLKQLFNKPSLKSNDKASSMMALVQANWSCGAGDC